MNIQETDEQRHERLARALRSNLRNNEQQQEQTRSTLAALQTYAGTLQNQIACQQHEWQQVRVDGYSGGFPMPEYCYKDACIHCGVIDHMRDPTAPVAKDVPLKTPYGSWIHGEWFHDPFVGVSALHQYYVNIANGYPCGVFNPIKALT